MKPRASGAGHPRFKAGWRSYTESLRHAACGLLAGALLYPTGAVSPSAGTPVSRILDQATTAARRPPPTLPVRAIPRPDSVWVPDRYVPLPGHPTGVWIPAHWERRLPSGEYHVPPLGGVAPNGTAVHVPAGIRPPVEQRIGP